ncbi:bifunctional 5,10-methylenetetrahydrofolate dehydrogenase/5,10-methenyltetrahydrofolate cyclohydrolase [archaeon]|nr:bifunctional 5,10-methylenetetrahydrofolate dehydrogenase/5,10-methenyltetrahydrofolate cyclohydrolase [archaeon]
MIAELNESKNVNGILIELPLPAHLDKYKLLDLIDPLKDVDGLTSYNASRLIKGEEYFRPCTPKGIVDLLDHYKISITDKNVVILGRSEIVGIPLQKIMMCEGANVTICNTKTEKIEEIMSKAEILVSAIGKPHYIKKEMVSRGVIVIDVGINNFSGKIVGDVDFENVIEKASYITPVPGGVGPMTVTSLAYNVLKASKLNPKII